MFSKNCPRLSRVFEVLMMGVILFLENWNHLLFQEGKKSSRLVKPQGRSQQLVMDVLAKEKDATCPQPSCASPDPLAVMAVERDGENGLPHRNNFSAPKPLWQVLRNERLQIRDSSVNCSNTHITPAGTRCQKRDF